MENEEKQLEKGIGEMHKLHETMADGRRYIIFYTFENEEPQLQKEVSENV